MVITDEKLEEQTNYLLTYDVQEAVIADFNAKAKAIVVKDWQDEESVKAARSLRTEINALFEKIDRRRKDLKNFIDKKGKAVTVQLTEPIDYLTSQIGIRDKELKRQKEEAEQARQAIVSERERLLREQGCDTAVYLLDPEFCDNEKFTGLLEKAKADKVLRDQELKRQEEERLRLEAEQKAKDEELELLRAQNKLLEKKVELTKVDILPPAEAENERVNEILKTFPTSVALAYRIIELEEEVSFLRSLESSSDEALF